MNFWDITNKMSFGFSLWKKSPMIWFLYVLKPWKWSLSSPSYQHYMCTKIIFNSMWINKYYFIAFKNWYCFSEETFKWDDAWCMYRSKILMWKIDCTYHKFTIESKLFMKVAKLCRHFIFWLNCILDFIYITSPGA